MTQATVILRYASGQAPDALARAERLQAAGHQVILAGPEASALPAHDGIRRIDASNRAEGLRAAVAQVSTPVTVLDDPGSAVSSLIGPIYDNTADAVFGSRPRGAGLADRALGVLAGLIADVGLADPLTTVRAFRTSSLQSLSLTSQGEGIDAEILVKLAAQRFRILEVPVHEPALNGASFSGRLDQARTLLRYATVQNDADNAHEGYNTLERMDGARHYNAWIGRQLRAHLGKRVLEVGAGIGTITRELEPGLELLLALEVEAFYVERLKNLFRDKPHVRPYLSGVELADWERLQAEKLDTVVLSNVLEHIEDDGRAVRNFRLVLQPGGRLVTWVPALPKLFGSLDKAVGHFRRYTQDSLRKVVEENGFALERMEWMNLVGIPGWWMNSVVLGRRAMPSLQLRAYDAVAPLIAQAESMVKLPIGLSLLAVARAV